MFTWKMAVIIVQLVVNGDADAADWTNLYLVLSICLLSCVCKIWSYDVQELKKHGRMVFVYSINKRHANIQIQ